MGNRFNRIAWRKAVGCVTAAFYVATIPVANWLIGQYPHGVGVGFHLTAPAGVYVAGPALVLRDAVQWFFGKRASLVATAVGVVASYSLASPNLALAAATAFAASEATDFALFSLGRKAAWLRVLRAGATGLVVDSVIFLSMAFGSLEFLPGQIVGKTYGVALGALTTLLGRIAFERIPVLHRNS